MPTLHATRTPHGRSAGWLFAFLLLTLAASRAEAQVREPDNFLATTLTFSSAHRLRNVSTRHVSPMLSAGFRVSESGQLRLDWGLPYTSFEPRRDPVGRQSHSGSSNLLIGLHHVSSFADDTLFTRIGVAVAVPLARRNDSDTEGPRSFQTEGLNYDTAAAVRGLADPWLWALDTTSFVLPLTLGMDLPGFQLRADVAFGMLVPTSRATQDTHFVAQGSLEASLGLGLLEPGVKLQVVSPYLSKATWDGENARASVEPFIRLQLGPLFARAGVRIDLGDPEAPPSPSPSRMWALGVGLGLGF